jgi:hypothetical protein
MKLLHRLLTPLNRWRIVPVVALGILLFFSAPTWGTSKGLHRREGKVQSEGYRQGNFTKEWKASDARDKKKIMIARERTKERSYPNKGRPEKSWRDYESLSPEEKARFNRKFEEWKSLPPERRKALRHKWKQWQELPPEERAIYEQRFHQWQRLSPEEREDIRERLEEWNGLPPEEKEKLRRRFREQ